MHPLAWYIDAVLSIVTTSWGEMPEPRKTRPISWIKAAAKDFERFPEGAQSVLLTALTIAADGGKADIAKPLKGIASGVFELALAFKGDAFRLVYGLQLDDDVWVIHAFQKKSRHGIKTPKQEIDVVKDRVKRLKEALR
jgi:phage-related protein